SELVSVRRDAPTSAGSAVSLNDALPISPPRPAGGPAGSAGRSRPPAAAPAVRSVAGTPAAPAARARPGRAARGSAASTPPPAPGAPRPRRGRAPGPRFLPPERHPGGNGAPGFPAARSARPARPGAPAPGPAGWKSVHSGPAAACPPTAPADAPPARGPGAGTAGVTG